MEIWLDTIDYDVIADGVKTGILAGVTTNPSILSKAQDVAGTLKRILEIQEGPVAVQVTSQDPAGMIEEGRRIFAFSNRMVVKVPVNRNGLIAMQVLRKEKIPLLGTGVLYASQALLAATLEVEFIAPYFAHMSDGEAELKTIVEMYRAQKIPTKILAASLRQLDQILYCALLGIDAVTIKPELYHKLTADMPAVEKFSEKFSSEWAQSQGKATIKAILDGASR